MIGQILGAENVVRVERKIGRIRLTICVEEEIEGHDGTGRPLPQPKLMQPQVTMPWTDIGRRVNEIGHEFANELIGE